jgi:hypothetical protein
VERGSDLLAEGVVFQFLHRLFEGRRVFVLVEGREEKSGHFIADGG